MPSTTTVKKKRAKLASTAFYKPGSPEHEEAARDYFCARTIELLTEYLGKIGTFTQSQRDEIIAVLCAGDPAPEPEQP